MIFSFRQHTSCRFRCELRKRTVLALAAGFLFVGATGVAAQSTQQGMRAARQETWSAHGSRVALKTNLLFDLAGAPNLGVEVPLGGGFSAAADFAYAYWQIGNTYALQTIQGGVSAKYWFAPSRQYPERPLTGWNAGVYATYSSRYDVQWRSGWQGDGFWSGGLGAGYSLPVARSFNIEFALAAGWFYTPEVRGYDKPVEGHLVWRETRKNVQRFSLTKVQANLVWLIGGGKR